MNPDEAMKKISETRIEVLNIMRELDDKLLKKFWVDLLSKTLSGKIIRRILRKIAAGETDDLGDTSTLADPSVVKDLIKGRQ